MTVAELIKLLTPLPPELPVFVEGYEYGVEEATDCTKATIALEYHSGNWGGEAEVIPETDLADSYYDEYAKAQVVYIRREA